MTARADEIQSAMGTILSELLSGGKFLEHVEDSPAEFAAHLQRETAKWARVVKDAGIKAD